MLRQLHALADAESNLDIHKKKLSDIDEKVLQSLHPSTIMKFINELLNNVRFSLLKISQLAPLHKKFTQLKSQFDLKTYDLSLFQNRAEQNEHSKVINV